MGRHYIYTIRAQDPLRAPAFGGSDSLRTEKDGLFALLVDWDDRFVRNRSKLEALARPVLDC